jgi:DNA-directed RNA polymerase subunit H
MVTKKTTKTSKTVKKPTRKVVTPVKKKAAPKPKVKKIKTKFVETSFDVRTHILVPKHTLLNEKERERLFVKYNITEKELPKILLTDPAIRSLKPKTGDVIKIERKSPTSGNAIFYRGVINE